MFHNPYDLSTENLMFDQLSQHLSAEHLTSAARKTVILQFCGHISCYSQITSAGWLGRLPDSGIPLISKFYQSKKYQIQRLPGTLSQTQSTSQGT